MTATEALIGVGSNLGDRLAWLRFAADRIGSLPGTRVAAASAVYETDPVGGPTQGPYLNACFVLETGLRPRALLSALLAIEAEAGRCREAPNSPRTLDLDVLLLREGPLLEEGLEVPHPRLRSRAFALVPAAEIAGSWEVPPDRETLRALAARASRAGVRRFAGPELLGRRA